jgi:aminopeptidase N
VVGVLPRETAESVVEPLLSLAASAADYWSPPSQRDRLMEEVADLSLSLVRNPAVRLPAVRVLAGTATRSDQLDQLADLADTPDLHWRRLTRLAELGLLDEDEVAQLLASDPNPDAWSSAETARAAQPDAAAKQRAWELAVTQRKVPVDRMGQFGNAFWRRGQDEVLAPYRDAYLDGLAGMGASGMQWALALTRSMFPRADADRLFLERLEAAAFAPDVAPVVSLRVRERVDLLGRMLTGRAG